MQFPNLSISKPRGDKLLLLLTLMLVGSSCSSANALDDIKPWKLSSPDSKIAILLSLDAQGIAKYWIECEGQMVVLPSLLGLVCDDGDFSVGLEYLSESNLEASQQQYELFSGPRSRVDKLLHRKAFRFKNATGQRMDIQFAASNEGVAFCYQFPESQAKRQKISEERTVFSIPKHATGWLTPYHKAGKHTPNNEDYYFPITVGDPPPNSRAVARGWGMPALFRLEQEGLSLLLLESSTVGEYCGCHLVNGESPGQFKIAFAFKDENFQRLKINPSALPTVENPGATPWRVILVGNPSDFVESTLVTDLAPPSRIKDTSWIKAGRASWGWLTHPEGPYEQTFFNKFTDLAARYGWEYTTFDGGWWDVDLTSLCEYAQKRDVLPIAWVYSRDMCNASQRRAKLDHLKKCGVVGVKIDFWSSEMQGALQVIQETLADAGDRQMVVLLHGCPLPRGWHRTWPNLLSCEAVLGLEGYMYAEHYSEKVAQLNTVLPFTRNVAGPMDFTPFLLGQPGSARITTAAHELATALVFSSGVIHYADTPEIYTDLPEAVQAILRDFPARWDQTHCFIGEPGEAIVLGRRIGDTWYIAGLNGLDKNKRVVIQLAELGLQNRSFTAITEGQDRKMTYRVSQAISGVEWSHTMPARGGFLLRFGTHSK